MNFVLVDVIGRVYELLIYEIGMIEKEITKIIED
jgi:hypothetical protein